MAIRGLVERDGGLGPLTVATRLVNPVYSAQHRGDDYFTIMINEVMERYPDAHNGRGRWSARSEVGKSEDIALFFTNSLWLHELESKIHPFGEISARQLKSELMDRAQSMLEGEQKVIHQRLRLDTLTNIRAVIGVAQPPRQLQAALRGLANRLDVSSTDGLAIAEIRAVDEALEKYVHKVANMSESSATDRIRAIHDAIDVGKRNLENNIPPTRTGADGESLAGPFKQSNRAKLIAVLQTMPYIEGGSRIMAARGNHEVLQVFGSSQGNQ